MSQIDDLYQEILGRSRDKTEIGSEEENAAKYGIDSIRNNLLERRDNAPNYGQAEGQASVNYGGGGGNDSIYPDWYKSYVETTLAQQQADRQQAKERSDALYSTLNTRANQGLEVNANDPVIAGQTNAYAAATDRNRRNYLSDIAEQRGPLANIQGERRMTAEKAGQGVAGFQAQLIGNELSARRAEIANALSQMGGMLSGDQARSLQSQLALYDQALGQAGLANQSRGLDIQQELGQGQLALGQGQLALGNRSLDTSNDQFLRQLGLTAWNLGDQSNLSWARLGV